MEEFYIELSRIGQRGKFDLTHQAAEPDGRPWLSIHGEHLEAFISRFEDSDSRRLYSIYVYFLDRINAHDNLEWELNVLNEAEDDIPIEAHTDWRTALINAANKYERKMIAEALPLAWEQYRLMSIWA